VSRPKFGHRALIASKTAFLRRKSRRNVNFKRLHEGIMAFRAKAKFIEYIFKMCNAIGCIFATPRSATGGMAGELR
jgi:hypothetical protein